MNPNNRTIYTLAIFSLLAVICTACSGGASNLSSEESAIAARLTVAAVDAVSEQSNRVDNAGASDPVAVPTSSMTPQRLSVAILRPDENTAATPTFTYAPPTPTPTFTYAPPTPTPTFTYAPPTPTPTFTYAPPTPTPTFTYAPPTPTPTFTYAPPVPTNTPVLLSSQPQSSQPQSSQPQSSQSQSQTGTQTSGAPNSSSATTASSTANFGGIWSTNLGIVDLRQIDNQVVGTYQLYGNTERYVLTGSVSGRTLTGEYTGFDGGTVRFELDPSGDGFDGSWFYQGGGDANHWCGVRSGPLKPWCGYSGPWESIGDYIPETPPITEVVQTGDKIQGTFLNGVYDEVGRLEGQVGSQGPGSHLVAIGRWYIAGYSGDFSWELLDRRSDQTVGYSVTSDGVTHQWCNWRPGLSMPAECFKP